MSGLSYTRIRDRAMEPTLPFGAGALFRKVDRVKRGDIVLVECPEHGRLVRKVRAVSQSGRVALQRLNRSDDTAVRVEHVQPDAVLGKLAVRIPGLSVLPAKPKPSPTEMDQKSA